MIKYFKENMEILNKSIESLEDKVWNQVLDDCMETVRKGGKIIASGLGKNVPICEKFVGTLNSFGIPAYFLHSNTAVHGDLGIVGDKDLVFILSKSGNTDESILLTSYLLDRGVNTWLLSCSPMSRLTDMLEKRIILELEHEGDLWNIAPNNSTTVFLIFLQGVAVALSDKLGVQLATFKKNHPGGSIGEKLRAKAV